MNNCALHEMFKHLIYMLRGRNNPYFVLTWLTFFFKLTHCFSLMSASDGQWIKESPISILIIKWRMWREEDHFYESCFINLKAYQVDLNFITSAIFFKALWVFVRVILLIIHLVLMCSIYVCHSLWVFNIHMPFGSWKHVAI